MAGSVRINGRNDGKWEINGTDIAMWGLALKRGSYDSLLAYPAVKEYLTEDIRENNGEDVIVAMPRVRARSVLLTFVLYGEHYQMWDRYESFLARLMMFGTFTFTCVEHNRNYRLRFESGESRREIMMKGTGKQMLEITLRFKQDNPLDVTQSFELKTEGSNSVNITTESGENIIVEFGIYS